MKNPWSVFFDFWHNLTKLGMMTQDFLKQTAWAVNPAFFYQWCVIVIDFLKESGAPTFDQPSWEMLKEILNKRAESLDGTATNLYLTQTMTDWENYDYTVAPPPNPYVPWTGPYSTVVSGYDRISSIMRSLSTRLFGYEENQDRDILMRSITLFEAVDCLWYGTKKMCDNPMFRMRDPKVPKWTTPYPWLEFVEKDLRKIRDSIGKQDDLIPNEIDPDEVPWSMPL